MIDGITRDILEQRDNIENQRNREFNSNRETLIKKQDKEIDRLTAESTEWESKYYQLQNEIERLNNIIDELEKYINEVNNIITTDDIKENMYICGRYDENLDILKKLNKLKEK